MDTKTYKPVLTWLMAAIFVMNAFFMPISRVNADTPTTIDATVVVTGVDEGGIIDSSAGVGITITLPSIPVIGDGVDDYFVYGDSVILLISEHFKFDPLPLDQDLYFGAIKVGTVKFSNNAAGQAVATIVFDGEEYIFDPTKLPEGVPPYAEVSAEFACNLVFNGEYEVGDDGEEYVTILDKTYRLQLPGDVITHTVTKEVASIDLNEGTITWTVTVTGESDTVPDPTPLNLGGYLFEDDLASVGAYVAGSFIFNGVAVDPTITGTLMSYSFPDPSVSPVTITFKTEIPGPVLAGGGTITNTADISDDELPIGSDSASATITGPSISKSGTAHDGFGGDGSYNPIDRTITWAIPVDNAGRTLYDLIITDPLTGGLGFQSAVWQRWDEVSGTWVDVPGLSWSTEPTGGAYEIGDVNYKGRLVIVSTVPDSDDGSVTSKTYYNSASASWTGADGTPGSGNSGSTGVSIGYDAITKSGTQTEDDIENRQITWTINVDLKGQSATDFVYYDLFVHDAVTTNAALMASANWPAGITIGSSGVSRNNGQKFVAVDSKDNHLTVETFDLEGLGTLVKVSNLRSLGTNQVVLRSQVIDPNILAGNKASQTVVNVASLYKGTTYRGQSQASVPFNNMVLAKQMLKRVEVANDHDPNLEIDPNNSTTALEAGFHYDFREVIFRLVVNKTGLDFGDVETNLPDGFGDVTVTDTLPAGWVFAPFSGGEMFLIYDVNTTSGATIPALDPATITGFTNNVGTSIATFTFEDLDKPYVILVKAKPTDETFDGYLVGANVHTKTNTANLSAENWTPGVTVTQDVRVRTEIIDKSIVLTRQYDGILTWLLDYIPFNRPIATGIQDVLPEGIDLRIDSSGNLIWEQGGVRNITVYELIPNANGDGGFTQGPELDLATIQAKLVYNNATRTLTFTFPNNTKGYRLSYLTDITGQPGEITNSAKLLGAEGEGTGTSESFIITEQHGSATMLHSGFVSIKKTDAEGGILPGAEFTLYNTDASGNASTPRAVRVSDANGNIRIYGLQPGTYILRETNPPAGYYHISLEFVIVVGSNFATTINGRPMSIPSPYEVVNYPRLQASGSLTISKTVAGNGGDPNKLFAFTVTFDDAPYEYPYAGSGGAANGAIRSGDTIYLAHGQSITISELPIGAAYTVIEADYSADGYITTYTGTTGVIESGEPSLAAFTNTREVGSLTIRKTVTGNLANRDKYFTFTVEFGSDKVYNYHGSKSGTIRSGESVQLKHGEFIVIEDILVGTSYKVTEVEANLGGYGTSYTGTVGIMDTAGKVAAFVNWRSSVPYTGDDNTATIARIGLMTSASILVLSAASFGFLQYKKRRQTQR